MSVIRHCTCGNGEAEEDRGAVLDCAVHGFEARTEQARRITGGAFEVERLRKQLEGAVEALRRIAAGHPHASKLAGEALDALPPDDNVYDPPYIERGQ
jgi:hypothetical protein